MKGPAIFLAQFASTKPPFDIRSHVIRRASHAFDDFAASSTDPRAHARILGLDP